MANDKYGNIDELLSGAGSDEKEENTPRRSRRPSPALGVMTGDKRPTSVTDGLKADKQKAEKALELMVRRSGSRGPTLSPPRRLAAFRPSPPRCLRVSQILQSVPASYARGIVIAPDTHVVVRMALVFTPH